MISTGATALIAGAVILFFSNFGFGSDYDIYGTLGVNKN